MTDELPDGWIIVDGKQYVPVEEAAHLAANQCLHGLVGDEGGNVHCPKIQELKSDLNRAIEFIEGIDAEANNNVLDCSRLLRRIKK